MIQYQTGVITDSALRVLLIESDATAAALTETQLRERMGARVHVVWMRGLADAIRALME